MAMLDAPNPTPQPEEFKLTSIRYDCPKHGRVNSTMSFRVEICGEQPDEWAHYCAACMQEMIAKHCEKVKEAPND